MCRAAYENCLGVRSAVSVMAADETLPRLSHKEIAILRVLVASKEPMYGLDIVSQTQIGRGWLYVTLAKMEDRLLIDSELEEPAPAGMLARRMYRATQLGARCVSR